MKTSKKFLTILTLCIALLLTACGTTDAAGTDKTNESLTETGTVSTDSSNTVLNDLYQQENQIFADHEAVWNKVFGMMSKSGVDPSANYADYLADTVEANKDSFTDDELKTLTDDMETIRKIEEQIAELEQGTTTADHTAPENNSESAMKEAAAVLESQGAKYRNISIDSASDAGKYASDIMAFPTTILVDRNGNIVGDPILGGRDFFIHLLTPTILFDIIYQELNIP